MKGYWFLVIGLLAALFAGCGGGGKTEKDEAAPVRTLEVPVSLDGFETAETIGLIMAEQHDYFAKAGLTVTTLAPLSPTRTIHYVASGGDLIGVAHGPQVVLSREKGIPVVILGSLVSHSTAAMIWPQKSDINSIADLKGKTIAIPGLSFQRSFLQYVLSRAGLTLDDVEVKTVRNDLVAALVKGQADAIFGGSGNVEGADLESRGFQPVVTSVRKLGIPDYDELVLVARADRTKEEPGLMHDFVAATARGAAAATERPKSALQALDAVGETNPEASPKARAAEVEQTLPLLSKSGQINSDQLKRLVDWMHEQGMIRRKMPIETLLAQP